MNSLCKIMTCILCFVVLFHLFIPVSAAETGIVSLDVEAKETTVTVTVAMKATEITSLGVYVVYSNGLTLSNTEWLIEGLITSFDNTKDKGVYSPGSTPATISGNIFQFTLNAPQNITNTPKVTVTLIGKHGADTVFEETVSKIIGDAQVIWGDADGNGFVDAFDASLIKKYSVGSIRETELNLTVSDVDGDGYVDAFDASLIQKFCVGAIENFPIEVTQ